MADMALHRDADSRLCLTSIGEVCNVEDAWRAGCLLGALQNVVKSGGTCRHAFTMSKLPLSFVSVHKTHIKAM